MTVIPRFANFTEFYAFYLSVHSNRWNRRFHLLGQTSLLLLLLAFVLTLNVWLLVAAPLAGYGFSWFGHFCIEGSHPATFGYPIYSLCGDYVMCKDMLTGKIGF